MGADWSVSFPFEIFPFKPEGNEPRQALLSLGGSIFPSEAKVVLTGSRALRLMSLTQKVHLIWSLGSLSLSPGSAMC